MTRSAVTLSGGAAGAKGLSGVAPKRCFAALSMPRSAVTLSGGAAGAKGLSGVAPKRCFAALRVRVTVETHEAMPYYVYIMASRSKVLYVGVTNDLQRRVCQHKQKLMPGFTKRYSVTHLVYFEDTTDVREAIAREKQIKGWLRRKKIALIERVNPTWSDLSEGWSVE